MFLALVALTGLVLAVATRRPLNALLAKRFSRTELLWLGAGSHLLLVPPALYPLLSTSPVPGFPRAGGLIYIASLTVLLAFAWLNRSNPGIAAIGLGLLMNTIVIAANGGQMPVDAVKLAAKGELEEIVAVEKTGGWSQYVVAGESTRVGLLGDWITMPQPARPPAIISPGDLMITVGILLFFLVIPEEKVHPLSSSPDRS